MILDEIVKRKRKEVTELKRRLPIEKMVHLANKEKNPHRSFLKALSKNKLNLICELKKASPSKGMIRQQFEPLSLAKSFESAGASAISVLTEKHYFKGNPKTLKQIRAVTRIPLLRKDFIIDPYQIYETKILGADAFLIIVRLVSDKLLKQMLKIARQIGLEVLVEVHTRRELKRALKAESKIVGINNRNLETLKVDLTVSEKLIRLIPKGIITVIESGIETRDNILRYQILGAHNFLIGTQLMKSNHVGDKIAELLTDPRNDASS